MLKNIVFVKTINYIYRNKFNTKIMKLKCNVCLESTIVELPNPEEDKIIYCPICDKQLAYGFLDYKNKPYWHVIDGKFDEKWGGIPVETIEL